MRPHSTDELLWHMPTVARRASDEWSRGFALSVVRQAQRRGWRPSAKQLALMQRMVSELFTGPADDGALIE